MQKVVCSHHVNHPDSIVNSQLIQNSCLANILLIESQNHIINTRHYGFITHHYIDTSANEDNSFQNHIH